MKPQTARLLVSVRDAKEAQDALLGGADIIDVKEPNHGSLGCASPECVSAVLKTVNRRVPVTAALGELHENNSTQDLPIGVFAVKFGLAGQFDANKNSQRQTVAIETWQETWKARWKDWLGERVAVAYADYHESMCPFPQEVAKVACEMGCTYFLIDTFQKTVSLRELMSVPDVAAQLDSAVEYAQKAGLKIVVAGSLQVGDFPYFRDRWGPDVFAVRGAACAGERTGVICRHKVSQLQKTLNEVQSDSASPSASKA